MAGRAEFNSGKFRELVLLLVARSSGDQRMSRVKLNKLLYLCDFEAYRLLGRSMTGAIYLRGEFGPMAAELPIAEDDLGRAGYLTWRQVEAGPYTQQIPVATETPDESLFSTEELTIAASVLSTLADHGGKAASDWSHENSVGWRVVKENGNEIPYETAFIEVEPIPENDVQRAYAFVREQGWVRGAA